MISPFSSKFLLPRCFPGRAYSMCVHAPSHAAAASIGPANRLSESLFSSPPAKFRLPIPPHPSTGQPTHLSPAPPNHNPRNTTKPSKDRRSRQGLVQCTVSSVSRHPTPLHLSSIFSRETEETFIISGAPCRKFAVCPRFAPRRDLSVLVSPKTAPHPRRAALPPNPAKRC